MNLHQMAIAICCLAYCSLSGCVTPFATRELRVIEPKSSETKAFAVDYSAVPEQYIRRVEETGEKGQPVTVLYLQTRVKVTLVPVHESVRAEASPGRKAE
jgi:hypothetical protein